MTMRWLMRGEPESERPALGAWGAGGVRMRHGSQHTPRSTLTLTFTRTPTCRQAEARRGVLATRMQTHRPVSAIKP